MQMLAHAAQYTNTGGNCEISPNLALGVGWNFSYVGGSALLSDQLSPDERAKTQGASDLLIGLATAAASLGTGLLFAGAGYTGIGIVGAIASIVPVGLAGWWMVRRQRLGGGVALDERCLSQADAAQTFVGASLPASCQL